MLPLTGFIAVGSLGYFLFLSCSRPAYDTDRLAMRNSTLVQLSTMEALYMLQIILSLTTLHHSPGA
jgi:hypothetical protein